MFFQPVCLHTDTELCFWAIDPVKPHPRGGDFERALLQCAARWIHSLQTVTPLGLNEDLVLNCFLWIYFSIVPVRCFLSFTYYTRPLCFPVMPVWCTIFWSIPLDCGECFLSVLCTCLMYTGYIVLYILLSPCKCCPRFSYAQALPFYII